MKKRFLALVLLAVLCVSALPMTSAVAEEDFIPVYKTDGKEAELDVPETIDVDVTVRESQVIRTTEDRALLGMCLEWGRSNSGFMKSGNSTEFNDEYLKLVPELGSIHSTRTAGTSLNHYYWKNAIGPMAKRKSPGTHWAYSEGPQNYGPEEWIKQFQMINPDCEFIVGLNIHDTPENLADYAEFWLGDETTTYGKMRIDAGIPDPVNVGAFELGNEVDYTYIDNPSEYGNICKKVILAIRERFPEAKFVMCGKTYPLEQDIKDMTWRRWIIDNMKIIGEYVDYISFHAYYDGQTMAWTELYLDQMQEDIRSVVGDKEIKFAFTEAAVWPRNGGHTNWPESQTQMLTGVLSTADFLSRMFKRTDTWSSSYYCWGANLVQNWGVLGPGVNEDKWKNNQELLYEQKWYTGGIIKMYDLYDKMLGEKVLYSHAKSDNKYGLYEHRNSKYSAFATQNGDDELMLILTNKTEFKKFNTNFTFENEYELVEETIFTAPDFESKVYGKDTADVFTTTTTPMSVKNFTNYVAPEKSLVFLRLKRTNKALGGDEEVAFEGEAKFDDVDDFWGKNEILNLAEQGLVSGVSESKFAPFENLTRAQAAQMISNALVPESENYSSLFSDVADDAWYAQAVYNVYKAGFMRGTGEGKFSPDKKITVEEFITLASRISKYYTGSEETEIVDTKFTDRFNFAGDISPWAKESMEYAINSGLLNRFYENGNLMPKENITRGQAAVLIYRLNSLK